MKKYVTNYSYIVQILSDTPTYIGENFPHDDIPQIVENKYDAQQFPNKSIARELVEKFLNYDGEDEDGLMLAWGLNEYGYRFLSRPNSGDVYASSRFLPDEHSDPEWYDDDESEYEPEDKTDREQWDDYYNDIKDMPEARDPFEVDTYCIQKYDKYPIYEPAEGGYYYEGLEPDTYETFPTMRAAIDALKKLVDEDNKGVSSTEEGYLVLGPDRRHAYTINHTYIGEGNEYYIEPINRRGHNATGKVPYQ